LANIFFIHGLKSPTNLENHENPSFSVSHVKLPVGQVETTNLFFLLLMEIRLTTWDGQNLVNNGVKVGKVRSNWCKVSSINRIDVLWPNKNLGKSRSSSSRQRSKMKIAFGPWEIGGCWGTEWFKW